MMVLVTYDVETITAAGRKRLRNVAKVCTNFGQRVQNSVFECVVEPAQYVSLKGQLECIIDPVKDSLRFYHLGSKWYKKVEHVGTKDSFNPESDCLIV
jgi:CRISPR-associated protein Cas2